MTTSVAGRSVLPIISVGDTLSNGYRFEAIPDSIGISPNGQDTVDVFVSHETSLVPFPLAANITTCSTTTCRSGFGSDRNRHRVWHPEKKQPVKGGNINGTGLEDLSHFDFASNAKIT